MASILYIIANPKEEAKSFSLRTGRSFINEYKKQNPHDEIVEIDVYKRKIPFIDADILNGWDKLGKGAEFSSLDKAEQEKIAAINSIVEEFISADKYVIVNPMWNFSLPPLLKAYIDCIVIARKTFTFTENGPVGLLKNKKILHIQASGGIYSNSPNEHADSYLKAILGLLGITDYNSVLLEGTNLFPERADLILQNGKEQAESMALDF